MIDLDDRWIEIRDQRRPRMPREWRDVIGEVVIDIPMANGSLERVAVQKFDVVGDEVQLR